MKTLSIIAGALAAIPLLTAAPVAAKERLTPEQELAKLLEGRVAGEPKRCLNTTNRMSSTIIDGTAIVYRDGRTLWVNRPDSGAKSLDDDDILVTRLWGSHLCNIDIVELRDRDSFFYSGFVSLGDFVPYRKVEVSN